MAPTLLGRWKRRDRLRAGPHVLASLCAISTAQATNVGGAELSVERTGDTQDCPDAVALAEAVRPRVDAPLRQALRIDLSLDARNGSYAAEMRVFGAREGLRRLQVKGADCTPLAEALTVALTLLLDPDAEPSIAEPVEARADESIAVSPGAQGEIAPQAVPKDGLPETTGLDENQLHEDAPEPVVRTLELWLALNPAVLTGIVPHWGFGVEGGLSLRTGRWSWELGGAWFAQKSVAFGEGEVVVGFSAARGAACFEGATRQLIRWGGCAVLLGGALTASGRNFDENQSERRPLGGAGLGARIGGSAFGPIGWVLRIDGLVPVHRESFSVEGLEGTAWQTRNVAVWGGLGLEAQIW